MRKMPARLLLVVALPAFAQTKKTSGDVAKVTGQVEELLTRHGRIDLLWFDGRPNIPEADKCVSQERIRKLQPGIVINPRLHGHGDFVTFERTLPKSASVRRRMARCARAFMKTWRSSPTG